MEGNVDSESCGKGLADESRVSPSFATLRESHFLHFPLFKQVVDPERGQFFGH